MGQESDGGKKSKNLTEWQKLLDNMRKNLPASFDEEFLVQEIIKNAEFINKMIS